MRLCSIMNKEDKKIFKLILQLLIFGAFCKVGFNIHSYLSIKDTLDTTRDILLLVILIVILIVLITTIGMAILKIKNRKKYIEETKRKLNNLENKMKSTSNKKR